MNNKIKRATAIYSGGGIYLFYAEQEDGNWILGNDMDLIMVNKNPLENEETFELSGHPEWQEAHLVEYIHEECFQQVLNSILDVIFEGRTIEEWNNFSKDELRKFYKSIPQI